MSACGYCGVDAGARPYAFKRDLPSVTAISGSYDDGKSRSFGWAASMIAAVTAVHETDKWSGLGTDDCTHEKDGLCPACRFIRSEFDRVWSAKAALGNHLHHLALSWALGEEVDEDETTAPYLDALARFYEDCKPEWVELEQTILYDEPKSSGYRGQFDAICDITVNDERARWLIDIKSGQFHPAEQTLQIAAYRNANWITSWENKTETKVRKMPVVQKTGVLLLGADGGYRIGELPASRDAFAIFLRLRDCWRWNKDIAKWVKDHPEAMVISTTDTGDKEAA